MSPGIRDGRCICGEIRAPRSILFIGLGAFFAPDPIFQEEQMENRELAFTKQAILATKDWDTYQVILRRCLRASEIMAKGEDKPDKL
jgi:hypothetical protein